jgi:ankyrin repeat protein
MSDSMGKAVYEAARAGNEAELTRLIGLGGNVNWHNPNEYGYTGLMIATLFGHEGCVRLLLAAEAIEVNAKVSLEHALSQHRRWVGFHVVISLLASRLSLEVRR